MKAYLLACVVVLGCGAVACRQAAMKPLPPGVEAETRLGSPDANNATPVLASWGRFVAAVWTAEKGGATDVYAALSDNNGATFGPPVRVNDVAGEAHVYGEDPPRVAVSAGTTEPEILVTWPSQRNKRLGLRSARSLDRGRTFSPSVSTGDVAIEGERGFQAVTVGRDHVARAVWLDQRRDPGTPHHANAGGDWDPMHLMYASSATDGRWGDEVRVASNVCGCCKTAIATGPDGAVYVAWRNIYPGNLRDISFAASRDGRTFSAPVRVSEDHWVLDGCPDDGPTMAVDASGAVHLVWPTLVDGPDPAIHLFYASSHDGKTFSPRQAIETLGTPKPAHPQMTLDQCGALVLAWDEARGSSRTIAMRRLVPLASGGVRSEALTLIGGGQTATYPVVTPVVGGVIAAWTEGVEHSVVGVRRIGLDSLCSATPRAKSSN
jgi:hypothetical protein